VTIEARTLSKLEYHLAEVIDFNFYIGSEEYHQYIGVLINYFDNKYGEVDAATQVAM
jgi:hypothetical protein